MNKIHNNIKRNILKNLYAKQAFNKGHLLQERVISGIPSHLKGKAKKILNQLVQQELIIIYKKTKHGIAYQLNIKKLKEIEYLIF